MKSKPKNSQPVAEDGAGKLLLGLQPLGMSGDAPSSRRWTRAWCFQPPVTTWDVPKCELNMNCDNSCGSKSSGFRAGMVPVLPGELQGHHGEKRGHCCTNCPHSMSFSPHTEPMRWWKQRVLLGWVECFVVLLIFSLLTHKMMVIVPKSCYSPCWENTL